MTKTQKPKKDKRKRKIFNKILSFILVVFTVIACSVIVYFNIIPYKYLIPGIVLVGLVVFFIAYKLNARTCLFTKIICVLCSLIFILIDVVGVVYAFGTIDFLNKVFDTGLRAETYNVYVLKDSNYKELTDLKGKKIVTYKSDSSTLDEAKKKLGDKLSYKEYEKDSLYASVDSVITKENDALFASSSLMDVYAEDHANIKDLKILKTITIYTKRKSIFKSVNVTSKPFVVYLSGVDSAGNINAVNRSDVNIMAFVNPDAGKVLLVSTPRDYYVTLGTKGKKDKLTHAGIYGIDESAKTLELLYGTTVNYYARVNFTSFVNIVNTLGGITVDVQAPDFSYNDGIYCGRGTICEQNSKRNFGSSMIYVKSGIQTLNGEQALAYARDRHQYKNGDADRQLHQQEVLEAIISKLSSPSVLTKYNSILSGVSKGILTNLDQKTITKLVNKQLDEKTKWKVEKYTVTGKDSSNFCYALGSNAYVMEPDLNSVSEAKIQIKTIMES
jgi:polyisoprenyl-teichoic acid--peptidoglycan teichoic acid transferase